MLMKEENGKEKGSVGGEGIRKGQERGRKEMEEKRGRKGKGRVEGRKENGERTGPQ
jgi:hypothetical protein